MKFWLILDCAVNVLLLGSFNETLSSRAWRMHIKPQPYFGWIALAIDFLFGEGHCEAQYLREQKYGNVWKAYKALY